MAFPWLRAGTRPALTADRLPSGRARAGRSADGRISCCRGQRLPTQCAPERKRWCHRRRRLRKNRRAVWRPCGSASGRRCQPESAGRFGAGPGLFLCLSYRGVFRGWALLRWRYAAGVGLMFFIAPVYEFNLAKRKKSKNRFVHLVALVFSRPIKMIEMPNQRDSRKKMMGVYLTEDELSDIRKIAELEGLSLTDVVKKLIAERADGKMPNQRDSGKKKIGVWLTEEEINSLDCIASDFGVDRSDLIRRITKGDLKVVSDDVFNGGGCAKQTKSWS